VTRLSPVSPGCYRFRTRIPLRPLAATQYLEHTAKRSITQAATRMSSNSEARPTSFAAALIKAVGPKYSYSRKRWDGFDAWQAHIRKSAAAVDSAFSAHRDRDLRRAVIAG
jgi:hypothetical protein